MAGSPKVAKRNTKPQRKVIGDKPPTKRTKTGCLTCRRRKKKCDERKPCCWHCERGNFVCTPCPPPTSVPGTNARRDILANSEHPWLPDSMNMLVARPLGDTNDLSSLDMLTVDSNGVTSGQANMGMMGYLDNDLDLFQNISSTSARPNESYMPPASFDDGIETIYTPLGLPQQTQSPLDFGSGYFPGGYGNPNQFFSPQSTPPFVVPNLQLPAVSVQPMSVPDLPFPVSGINTDVKRFLLHHFASILSPLLITSDGTSNPMVEVILPLAVADSIARDALLGMSAAHILRLRRTNDDQALLAYKCRLHTYASQRQAQRTTQILRSSPAERQAFTPQDLERTFATSLLLCLHEIIGGTGGSLCQHHLDVARRIYNKFYSMADKNAEHAGSPNPTPITEVNPFLLEYFAYHDRLAVVTMPSVQAEQGYVLAPAEASGKDISLVGVNDGLFHFVGRIALLREEAERRKRVDGNVLIKADGIRHDLKSWKPDHMASHDRQLLNQLYQYALSIWLFSITKPNEKSDPQIQDLVRWLTGRMSNISNNVKACLLFPLFTVGGAAIEQADRDAIADLFQQLRDWSSLGNIDEAFTVVQTMWRDHDAGVEKAWDWVTLLKKDGKSLLVT